MADWVTVFRQIHDILIPKLELDPWERAVYQYLLRHSRLIGKQDAAISIDGVAAGTGFSASKVRDSIRSMHSKGCLAVDERSRRGHVIRIYLPAEIDGLIQEAPEVVADIDTIDFYTNRKYLTPLLKPEEGRCFNVFDCH